MEGTEVTLRSKQDLCLPRPSRGGCGRKHPVREGGRESATPGEGKGQKEQGFLPCLGTGQVESWMLGCRGLGAPSAPSSSPGPIPSHPLFL